jgi:hypothetical protein
LQEIDFDRGISAEDADHYLEFIFFRVDFFDEAGEGLEGTFDNFDLLAWFEDLPGSDGAFAFNFPGFLED